MQGVAGVVVEPGDDLGVGAGCAVGLGESGVGEVGLPALVGLLGHHHHLTLSRGTINRILIRAGPRSSYIRFEVRSPPIRRSVG